MLGVRKCASKWVRGAGMRGRAASFGRRARAGVLVYLFFMYENASVCRAVLQDRGSGIRRSRGGVGGGGGQGEAGWGWFADI